MTLISFFIIWMALQIWWACMVHWPAAKPETVTLPPWILLLLALLAWLGSGWHLAMFVAVMPAWYCLDLDVYLGPDMQLQPEDPPAVLKIKFTNRVAVLWILVINVSAFLLKFLPCLKKEVF